MVKKGQSPQHIEAKPSQIGKLKQCRPLFSVGVEFEMWVPSFKPKYGFTFWVLKGCWKIVDP